MAGVMVTVNNGVPLPGYLTIEQEYETVWSATGTKPDPGWTLIDDAGHFHTYATGGDLPTLRSEQRHLDCDGSCDGLCDDEGYTVSEWRCRICEQSIEPGRLPGTEVRTIPTLSSWSVELSMDRPAATGTVSVRVQDAVGEVRFGVAVIVNVSATITDGEPPKFAIELQGNGPLALRMQA